jgi:hypothetical protein
MVPRGNCLGAMVPGELSGRHVFTKEVHNRVVVKGKKNTRDSKLHMERS